jgi:dipeptidyl aminopeptidase/acylaminoacyl peptidase
MMKRSLLFQILFAVTALAAQPDPEVPTIEDLLHLKTVGSAFISPDGKRVAYTVNEADFEQDAYITQIWLAGTETKTSFQLTRGQDSASNPKWSLDSRWLAFVSKRGGEKKQIFVIRPAGGEAVALTASESDVSDYEWAPDGKRIVYTASEPESDYLKERAEQVGDFEVVRREYRFSHLWSLDFEKALEKPVKGQQHTNGTSFSVNNFAFSPDGSKLAFSATVNPDLIHRGTSDIYLLAFDNHSIEKIVSQPGPDTSPHWSPDGSQIVFSTQMGRKLYYAWNNELAVVSVSGGELRVLTDDFDEMARLVTWNPDGIYFQANQKTATHLFRLDPVEKRISRVTKPDNLMAGSFSLSDDGKKLAFTAQSPASLREVYLSETRDFAPESLTNRTDQIDHFILGRREVISWKSKDGTVIEGVLIKPADFDPERKYPLLCVIHGGPTGIDRPYFRENRTYPVDIWAGRGALILKVNYRGSAGYGEAFRKLNMRNLGVGDAWDVLSGVDHFTQKGWVDPERIGCMGWSQGGYISAFLTTSSNRFAAISVGAGISNWATYYYNTDITPFTINYLGDDPADDPEIYRKTSPMTHIQNASTPTLIQHGELDRRVPIPNGYELRQGLEDRGVPVEMVVYKGFGHGINKPKSQRAAMWHNLVWFNHYIWGDDMPKLETPSLQELRH